MEKGRETVIVMENVLAHLSAEITTVMVPDLPQITIVAVNPKEMKAKTAQSTMSALALLFVAIALSAEILALGLQNAAHFPVIVRRVKGTATMIGNVKALWFAEVTTAMDKDS